MNGCGVKKLVLGLLVLLNAFVWPMWTGVDGWIAWFGVLWVVLGAYMLFAPAACPIGGSGVVARPAAPAKKAKKRR